MSGVRLDLAVVDDQMVKSTTTINLGPLLVPLGVVAGEAIGERCGAVMHNSTYEVHDIYDHNGYHGAAFGRMRGGRAV